MSKKETMMLEQIDGELEKRCGKAVAERVMKGKEDLKDLSSRDMAIWVKGAMNRLDDLVDTDKRIAVMIACGRNCCSVNKGVVNLLKKKRSKYQNLDEFFEAETKKPMRGTRLSRKGNTISFCYTPKTFKKGLRCYCRLVSSLPEKETMSMTYCQCSAGFVESLWEQVLERPVEVKVIRSALSGSDECEFRVVF